MVKEALVLKKAGFEVTVLYCPLSPWGDDFDKQLFQMYSDIQWIQVGAHPRKNSWIYMYVRLRMKFWEKVFKSFGNVFDAALKSSVLYSQDLEKAACSMKAHVYIGHNLGAIKAVALAAKKHGVKACFDFEDFHRGEDAKNSFHWKRVEIIENKYIPKLKGAWAASPLISDAYNLLFSNLNIETINNCFTLNYAFKSLRKLDDSQLKLFWFSQTIGKNRGLEQIIQSIGRLDNEQITLSLLGNCNIEIRRYFENLAQENGMKPKQIVFLNPVSEREIAHIASFHHIGVASEEPIVLNRDLCLTNKIFIYLLAGNALLFSNTSAQEKFASENPNIGLVYTNNDIESCSDRINFFFENRELLNLIRLNSFNLAKEQNWEREGEKLIAYLRVL